MASPARYEPLLPHLRPPSRLMTLEEYLAFEDTNIGRHEFVAGEVFAMSGTTRRHNQIAGNIYLHCRLAARGSSCRTSISDVKLRLTDRVYYPDVMVACGPEPADPRYEDAPCLLVEVLSESTQHTDRREKLAAYQGIASLGAYLVVDQERRLVDRYGRGDAGAWQRETLVDEGAVALPCPALALTLAEIYEGVELPPPADVLRVREEALAAYR